MSMMKSGNNYGNLISHCIIVKYFSLTRLLLLYINRIELKKYLLRKLRSQHAVRNLLVVRIHIQRYTINLSQSKSFSREKQTCIHSNTIGNHSRPAG